MISLLDIIQSIQIPILIKDDFVRNGKLVLDSRKRPIHYSGGFAVVFSFIINDSKWAFRCWSADLGNLEKRLSIIAKDLNAIQLPYFCNFVYSKCGIVVGGKVYPTTRMKWIDGLNLKDYIWIHRNDHNKLEALANSFATMCKDLTMHHISHGDLQHGNILVDKEDHLYLIDYDSLYTPSLDGERDIISGLPDYQHPARKTNKYASERVDFFSELVIYTSIVAIAQKPILAEKYNIESNDRLLFSKQDYHDFCNSEIYRDLISIGGICTELLKTFDEYLSIKDNINELLPFITVLENLQKKNNRLCYCTQCCTPFYPEENTNYCIYCGKLLYR